MTELIDKLKLSNKQLEMILEFFTPVKRLPPDAKEVDLYYHCSLCTESVNDRIGHYLKEHDKYTRIEKS